MLADKLRRMTNSKRGTKIINPIEYQENNYHNHHSQNHRRPPREFPSEGKNSVMPWIVD
jgi:hypothetical protein